MRTKFLPGLAFILSIIVSAVVASAEEWSRWRGPEGTGHYAGPELPTDRDALLWRTELPGVGQSSPVVWEDRVFLTSARGNRERVERIMLCLDRKTGKILWQDVAEVGGAEALHAMNTFASATCATDGEVVVAFFGRGGLHGYSLDGKSLWNLELGDFAGPWGTAASPILVGDLAIQNCDADDAAFLLAVDKRTGKPVWKTPRKVIRGWSTPILIGPENEPTLVLNGHYGVNAYDPKSGKELWFCKGDNGRGTPTVTPNNDGALIAVAGRPGEMIAVRPGGSGDVTETHGVWRVNRRGGRDLGSPVVVGRWLFVANMQGIASTYEAATGKLVWRGRLDGAFSASPIVDRGRILLPSEDGELLVIKPGDPTVVLERSQIGAADEMFRASPAADDGQLFLRANSAIYCLGSK